MTIFWERCSICGRYYPTKTCWLHPERNICPYCCLTCPEWNECPNRVWSPRITVTKKEAIEEKKEMREEAKAILEELLKKLEEGR
ncbi:MAG: hypothetical protein ABWW69_06840 [Pyrodictiaceae archaeon]